MYYCSSVHIVSKPLHHLMLALTTFATYNKSRTETSSKDSFALHLLHSIYQTIFLLGAWCFLLLPPPPPTPHWDRGLGPVFPLPNSPCARIRLWYLAVPLPGAPCGSRNLVMREQVPQCSCCQISRPAGSHAGQMTLQCRPDLG